MTEIKVGSEWVSNSGHKFTIKAIDEDKLFVKYDDGEHRVIAEDALRTFCKPAPVRRTVWLNVYEGFTHVYDKKERADIWKQGHLLFQQEVELIDPREGDKK